MLKSVLVILAITAISFSGCSDKSEEVDDADLRKLIIEAIAGDNDANVNLKGLLSTKHIGKSDYNQLTINTFTDKDKKYLTVLLEYFDPTLNLFAIYDSDLNFYIIDKSLNGYLSVEWAEMGDRNFVFLQERFLTKDVLTVDRLSIYEIFENSASLIYRSLSRLAIDNDISYQTIESITKNFILTKVGGIKDSGINNQLDTFYFNSGSKKYLSKFNLFNNYVKQEINEFAWITTKPQITADFIDTKSGLVGRGYKISMESGWEEIPLFIEDRLLRRSLSGPKFINKSLGAGITILEIPKGESGEKYSPYDLTETIKGRYTIRATSVYEIGKNYFQIFEHSCGEKKYLLLFEFPKSIYLEKKKVFDDIINSFTIDC